MNVLEVEPGVYSVLVGTRSIEVRIEGGDVYIEGVRYTVENRDPRKWTGRKGAAGASGRVTLRSTMPGKVVRLLKQPGEAVSAGEGVLVVEAMKMQNEVKSPRDGKVTKVSVLEGVTVAAGVELAVIE